MATNGERIWFAIEVAGEGFIGEVGGVFNEDDWISDKFVGGNLGSLWLTAKGIIKEQLDLEDKEEE